MNTLTHSRPLHSLIASAVFSILTASFSVVGAAADPAPTVIVKYGDLNVSTVLGATALYGRIRSAAETVCGQFDNRDLAFQARKSTCINRAIASAVTQVNAPALFVVYQARNRMPLASTLVSQNH